MLFVDDLTECTIQGLIIVLEEIKIIGRITIYLDRMDVERTINGDMCLDNKYMEKHINESQCLYQLAK